MSYLVFEYCYRDAGNFKAFGTVWLSGATAEFDRVAFVRFLDADTFFVAEQVGLPPLYEALFQLTGGAIADDHAWHEFLDLREAAPDERPDDVKVWGTVRELFCAFGTAGRCWKPQLSPNFTIGLEVLDLRRLINRIKRHQRSSYGCANLEIQDWRQT